MAKMINVLRFRIDGFIEVDLADPANVAAASELFNSIVAGTSTLADVTGSGCTFSRMRAIEEVPGPAPAAAKLDILPIPRREPDQAHDEQPADDDPLTPLSAG